MTKRIVLMLLVLAMVFGMVACGGNGATTETTPDGEEIVTLRWVGAGWSQNGKADKIIAKWNETHPNVKIEYVELGTAVDEGYLRNLDTMISGGEVVDVTYITYSDVYNRVINGGALPLDEYITAAGDDYEAM